MNFIEFGNPNENYKNKNVQFSMIIFIFLSFQVLVFLLTQLFVSIIQIIYGLVKTKVT